MPTPSEILASLSRIANDAIWLAVFWHLVIAAVAVAIVVGYRPSRRLAALLLAAPLASVSIAAWLFGNLFNGAVFALAVLLLSVLAINGSRAAVASDARWTAVLGVCLIAFGWVYPHFLVGYSPLAYLVAAPLGTLPCPTLALVTGATLVGGGLVGGAWRIALAVLAAFYSLFGLFRLGVVIDAFLLLGAVGLLFQHLLATRHGAPISSAS